MSEIVNKVIPIDQLKPHPRNYKLHPEKQIGRLRASVARFGQVRSVVAQEGANGKFLLVAGHGLTKAAREEGLNELRVDVIPADWTPEQVEGYLVADNLLGATAEDDNTLLAEILQEQANLDYDLASLGSSQEELDALLAGLSQEQLEVEAPDSFNEYDENIETEYCCPKCNYSWSGKPK
jgi:ParB-like chromosome segregation protein Spo0J